MAYDTFRNITFQQLECLIHLVTEHNFSRAAKKMALTQPAISKHIRNLEDAVGSRLVNRENKGVSLTPEGQIIYVFARKIVSLREDIKERLEGIKNKSSGRIKISASTIPATYILPLILSDFRKKYPEIETHVQSANSEEVIEKVINHQAEVGFIGQKPHNKKLYSEPLWQDRLVLVVPADHEWISAKEISIKDLLLAPFVLRETGSGTREIFRSFLTEHAGIDINQLNIVAEMGSSEAVKEAVIAGLGVSVLSVHAVKRELQQGIINEMNIQNWRIERRVYLIYRHQFGIKKHHQIFLDYVRASSGLLILKQSS